MIEVPIKVWLKSIKKLHKQMNAQKESLKKKLPESLKKTSVHKLPVCDENESRRKKRRAPKIFFDGRKSL